MLIEPYQTYTYFFFAQNAFEWTFQQPPDYLVHVMPHHSELKYEVDKKNETRIDHDAMVYPNRVLKLSSLKQESTGQSALGKSLAKNKLFL